MYGKRSNLSNCNYLPASVLTFPKQMALTFFSFILCVCEEMVDTYKYILLYILNSSTYIEQQYYIYVLDVYTTYICMCVKYMYVYYIYIYIAGIVVIYINRCVCLYVLV